MRKEQIDAICDILKYIQKQPQSKHTAQGIAKYWILQQRLEERIEDVTIALEYLVQQGFMEKVNNAGGNSYFKVNKNRLEDIPKTLQTFKR